MTGPFHADDQAELLGPIEAFDLGHPSTPNIHALQHHLVLETIAHLGAEGTPFIFRGGTALHTKLQDRVRFSIDADITTTDAGAIHESLRDFAKRFPNSDVRLVDPPQDLKIDGVAHTLEFHHHADAPTRILIEVVEVDADHDTEPLALQADGHSWSTSVTGPTLVDFMAQKLAVLGPTTVGKPVGRSPAVHPRANQGVCKQIFDLKVLLGMGLDGSSVKSSYADAVVEANLLRASSYEPEACLQDAAALLGHLALPHGKPYAQEYQHGLWQGYDGSKRWIAPEERERWQPRDYRISAGCLYRAAHILIRDSPDLSLAAKPLNGTPDDATIQRLDQAQGEAWFGEDFAVDAQLAWAWAPEEFW